MLQAGHLSWLDNARDANQVVVKAVAASGDSLQV